jgi:hypothetical protein
MISPARHTIRIPDGESLLDLADDLKVIFGVSMEGVSHPLQTAGELFDFITTELAEAPRGETCLTLMAFNRIRVVLAPYADRATVRPSTPLSTFNWSPKRWIRTLERDARLQAPEINLTLPGMIGSIAFFGGCALGAVSVTTPAFDLVYSLAALIAGALLISLDRGTWTARCVTIGDLAVAVAQRNIGQLAGEGGRLDKEEMWQALVAVLEERSLPDTGEIVRETRFA